jgi:hypothetical protein
MNTPHIPRADEKAQSGAAQAIKAAPVSGPESAYDIDGLALLATKAIEHAIAPVRYRALRLAAEKASDDCAREIAEEKERHAKRLAELQAIDTPTRKPRSDRGVPRGSKVPA